MTTYTVLQDRIANEVYQTADASNLSSSTGLSEAQIQAAILRAVEHYAREEFYFNQTTTTFPTVADQEYYTSSDLAAIATLVKIESMTGTLGSTNLPITSITHDWIDARQTGAVKAFPKHFAYYKQNIRLYPIPDAVYTITMAIIQKLAALSDGADSNAWTTDAAELIYQRAAADIRINILREAEAIAEMRGLMGTGYLSAMEGPACMALKRETRLRRSNDHLRVDDSLVSSGGFNISYQ